MMQSLLDQFNSWPFWLQLGVAAVSLAAVAWTVRAVLLGWAHAWRRRTASPVDDALVDVLGHASRPLLLVLALYVFSQVFVLPARLARLADRGLLLLGIALALYYGWQVLMMLLEGLASRHASIAHVRTPLRFISKIAFAVVAVMIVLDNIGVSLTAVWTTLGVGSVAVALALQDSLSNVFAGFYLLAEQPIRAGQYVKLDTGDEGYVDEVGWRSTRLRTLPNNIVIVPNTRLTQAIITNYYLPEPRMALLIRIGVNYESDTRTVERVLVQEATKATREIPGLLAEPAPFVRFIPGFGDSSLDFTLICQVREFVDQYAVQHELRHRIVERFRREGINIPFPIRTVYLHDAERQGSAPQRA